MIKINFVDFWPNFQETDNYFYDLLRTKYDVVIDRKCPQLLFYSCFGGVHREYVSKSIKKIFYAGENVRPDFEECDFAFTFDYSEEKRNYRLPLWVMNINWFNASYRKDRDISYLIPSGDLLVRRKVSSKSRFCNFIYSRPTFQRETFFRKLSQYKKVDSAGGFLNNTGSRLKGSATLDRHKVDFISDYKFSIAFENSSYPGYVTEKILHPFAVGSIPIYWGSPLIGNDFNEKAFLNARQFSTDEELIKEVIRIDKDDSLYEKMLSEPVFPGNKFPDFCLPESVMAYFEETILSV